MEMPQSELNAHMSRCRAAVQRFGGIDRRAVPTIHGGADAVSAAKVSANRSRPTLALAAKEQDGRVPCARCGRKFAPDRIAKHQYICSGLKHGPPRKPAQVATTAARQVASTRTAGMAPRRQIGQGGRAAMASQGRRRSSSSKWQEQSQAFRQAIRAARGGGGGAVGGGAYRGGGGGADRFEPCPHCRRTFAPSAWERHVEHCEHIINKPAPPPGAGSAMRPHPSLASGGRRTPLEASRTRALEAMARERRPQETDWHRAGTDRRRPEGRSRVMQQQMDALVFAGGASNSVLSSRHAVAARTSAPRTASRGSLTQPPAGSFARGSGRSSCVGQGPELDFGTLRPLSTAASGRRMSGSGGTGGTVVSGGMAGGGGVDPSNRTSADNPLAGMVSFQAAYRQR